MEDNTAQAPKTMYKITNIRIDIMCHTGKTTLYLPMTNEWQKLLYEEVCKKCLI